MKVLLIEDNPLDAKSLSEMLARSAFATFEMECRDNVPDAIERLQSKGVDIILYALNPDGANGLEGISKITQGFPEVAMIAIAPKYRVDLGKDTMAEGAHDFLVKDDYDITLLARMMVYVQERHSLQIRLNQQLIIDPVTELLNHHGLQQVVDRESAWVKRGVESGAILINLDNFKRVNQSVGHAAGDRILKEVGARLKDTLRVTDYLARIGGNEYMALLPQTRIGETLLVGQKLRRNVAKSPYVIARDAFNLNASIGVTSIKAKVPTVDELIKITNEELRKSRCATAERQKAYGKSLELYDVLGMLKNRESYRVVKQPLIDLRTDSPVGYEFLSRFCLSEFEEPNDFFKMCTQNDMLALVDHYCFLNCITASEDLPRSMRYHFNLFPSTLIDIEAQDLLDDVPGEYTQGTCCIEISEQQIIGEPGNLSKAVNTFRDRGVLIAMDDVGFGRSCLESLIVLEPDVVKIDRDCITGVAHDPAQRRSLGRFMKVLESLQVEIVAEGIENQADLEVIRDYGINYAQGYLWGQPE